MPAKGNSMCALQRGIVWDARIMCGLQREQFGTHGLCVACQSGTVCETRNMCGLPKRNSSGHTDHVWLAQGHTVWETRIWMTAHGSCVTFATKMDYDSGCMQMGLVWQNLFRHSFTIGDACRWGWCGRNGIPVIVRSGMHAVGVDVAELVSPLLYDWGCMQLG